MSSTRMTCPGCGAAIVSVIPFRPVRLADCPQCHLLFTPTPADLLSSTSRGAARAAELAWPEDDVPRPYPRSSPFDWRRRFRRLTFPELAVVLLACSVMLVLAGLVLKAYTLVIGGSGRIPVTATTPAPAPAAEKPETALAPATVVEIEDDHPPPLTKVPRSTTPP